MLRELIQKGGLVMYPLLLCSITALAVILERTFYFIKMRRAENGLSDRLHAFRRLLSVGETSKAALLLREGEGPVIRILLAGLTAGNRDDAERAMERTTGIERRRLYSGLTVLDTIVTAAPLLGLLGTVTGILNTFNLLGESPAIGNMQMVGRGIAEALITTATGLIIAIPALIALNYFAHRSESANELLEREVAEFAAFPPEWRKQDAKALDA